MISELLPTRFVAQQLARPRGLFGRWVMGAELNRLNKTMNDMAREQLRRAKHGPILEVGFGGGALLASLIAQGADVAGVEVSEAMIARARRQHRRAVARGQADIRLANVEHLPFANETFVAACAVNGIYFWPKPDAALQELCRVLQPGGLLVICFNPARELRTWSGSRHGFHLYDVDAVERLIAGAGLEVLGSPYSQDTRQGEIVCSLGRRPAV